MVRAALEEGDMEIDGERRGEGERVEEESEKPLVVIWTRDRIPRTKFA